MRRAILLIALAGGALLVAGVVLGQALGNGRQGLTSVARIDVNAGLRVAPVGSIVGAVINEHYWGPQDPVHSAWHDDYLGRTVESIRALAPASGRKFAVRFGHTPTDGSWGKDGYHWMDALDADAWDTSLDRFLQYVSLVDGDPYVAVNFGSGSASEAASFVAYANGTDPTNSFVQLRLNRGRIEPYSVRRWIVGFEQYASWETGNLDSREYDYANPEALNGGDAGWYGKPSSDPRNFAARAVEFAREMRAASPVPIKLYVPLNNWDLAYWGGPEESLSSLLAGLGGAADGLALHFYPSNPGYGETDEDLLGRPESFGSKIDLARGLMARYGRGSPLIDIVDVEYNNRSSSNGQTHQLVNGLFVADTLRILATKGVDSAFYFAISAPVGSRSGFTYFENGDVAAPMPTYLATMLVAKHLGSEVVKSDVSRGRMVTASGGVTGAFSYPSLTSLASLSPDGRYLYLIVINKHLAYDQDAEISIQGFQPSGEAEFTLLSGSNPGSVAGDVSLTRSSQPACSIFVHRFPRHSATAIRIPR